jgi:hypothetical protein
MVLGNRQELEENEARGIQKGLTVGQGEIGGTPND